MKKEKILASLIIGAVAIVFSGAITTIYGIITKQNGYVLAGLFSIMIGLFQGNIVSPAYRELLKEKEEVKKE